MFLSERSRADEDDEDEDDEGDEEITIVTTAKDCPTSRKIALAAKVKAFVPECEANGHYKATQCHESLCWCVDTVKGSPMRGTHQSDGKPDCSHAIAVKPQASPPAAGKNGCPAHRRERFLEELVDAFAREMQREMQSRFTLGREVLSCF